MIVRQKIKSHIDENSMTVRDLERKAGLKPSAVKNIINGSSKNPTIQIVHSIAKALGCTIDDLVENKASSKSSSESDWNCNLYIQVLTKSSKYLSKIGVTLSEKVFFILVDGDEIVVGKTSLLFKAAIKQ